MDNPTVRIGNRRIRLPRARWLRITIGIAFVLGGILSFLPILGLWMLPVGLLVLSQDVPTVRRWRRRSEVKWARWRARRRAQAAAR